jgi:hypothetical protein
MIEKRMYFGQVRSRKEGIYRENSSTLFKRIYIKLAYNVDKVLSVFYKVSTLRSLGACLGFIRIGRQDATNLI